MPRDIPPYCTDETRRAVEDHVKPVADEMGVSLTYLYDLLKGEKKDPFADFKLWFRDIARANPEGSQGYVDTLESIQRACATPARRKPRINYGTDDVRVQLQIACLKLGGALAVENSSETLPWLREVMRLGQGLERKLVVVDREGSPQLKAAGQRG